MPTGKNNTVTMTAEQIHRRKRTAEDDARLAKLRDLPDDKIDTTDIPDVADAIAAARDPVRALIFRAMQQRSITAYRLAMDAKHRCPTLAAPAVYEYLKGERSIGSEYLSALLITLDLLKEPTPNRKSLRETMTHGMVNGTYITSFHNEKSVPRMRKTYRGGLAGRTKSSNAR